MKQDWVEQYLECCFKLKSGDNLTAKNMAENGTYPVFGGNGIAGYHNEYNLSGSNVVIGRVGALCGNVRHITENIWLTDNAFKIVDFKYDFDHSFLTYLLNHKDLRSYARQAAQPVISNSSLKDVVLQFPKSLPEQQRIVSILDQCFAAIERSRNAAQQNLKNAKELFESYLEGVFGSADSPTTNDGWEVITLGEVSKINYGFTEKASFDEVGPKFLRITDIQDNGVNWGTVPFCKCSDNDLPKYKLETGDIVFARTGATTGKSYLIKNPPNAVFASYLIRLKMNSMNEFIPEFIFYFFKTKTYWDKINEGISGSAQGGFNATKLGELEFNFPKSLQEQQTIVHQLDALQAKTKRLEAIYQQKLLNLEELRKSVLQKAFNGEV